VSISRTFVPGGQRLFWWGCAAVVVTSLAASAPTAAADQRPPRALWKAFPLHQQPQHARAKERGDRQAPTPVQDRSGGSPNRKLLIGAAAIAVAGVALAVLFWLTSGRGTRLRLKRAARDHLEQVTYAGLAIAVGIGIGLLAGFYL
jgi:hypothetical protein